jgi:hypothetical protein
VRHKLNNNTQYIHSVTKAYFWYLDGTFITINEYTGSVEVYDESQMGSNMNYLILPEEQLELDNEDAETIQHEGENKSSEH